MPNKLLTNAEFDEDLTRAYANTECQHIMVSDVAFERMKKYMTQDKIDKAEYLREIIRSNQDYFLIKYV